MTDSSSRSHQALTPPKATPPSSLLAEKSAAGSVAGQTEESHWGWTRQHQWGIALLLTLCLGFLAWQLSGRPVYWNNTVQYSHAAGHYPAPLVQKTIDPNTADFASLVRIAGIGPTRATALLVWRKGREKRHPGQPAFRRLSDLRAIRGFGPKTLLHVAPFLRFPNQATLENIPGNASRPFTTGPAHR